MADDDQLLAGHCGDQAVRRSLRVGRRPDGHRVQVDLDDPPVGEHDLAGVHGQPLGGARLDAVEDGVDVPPSSGARDHSTGPTGAPRSELGSCLSPNIRQNSTLTTEISSAAVTTITPTGRVATTASRRWRCRVITASEARSAVMSVNEVTTPVGRPPGPEPERPAADLDPDQAAVGTVHAHHLPRDRSAGGQGDHGRVLGAGEVAAVVVHGVPARVQRGAPPQLVEAQPEDLARGRVAGQDLAVPALEGEALLERVEQHPRPVRVGFVPRGVRHASTLALGALRLEPFLNFG